MGVDLRILPQAHQEHYFSNDIITLERRSDLFDIIQKLENEKGLDIPRRGISCFCASSEDLGTHYGIATHTAYGMPIKSVLARELKQALAGYTPDEWKNRAFIAFLKELPDDLELFLFWD